MPRALHPHLQLKRARDIDDYCIDPEDALEDLPDRHHDAQLQAAKRRRVEAIALQCHRGRPPVILSAGLKGPFGNGWKNPWAQKAPRAGRTQSPNARRTQSSNAGRTRSSNAGRTRSSNAGETQSSKAGETQSSKAGRTQSSNAGRIRSSNAGRTQSPNAGRTRSSNAGRTQSSNAGKTQSSNTRRPQSLYAGTSPSKTRGAAERQARSRGKEKDAQRVATQNSTVPAAKGATTKSKTSSATSPETSRAADGNLEDRKQTYSLDDLEVTPVTAPLPEERIASGTAEHFSASTKEYIQSRSPLANPFWLRRPASQRRVHVNQPPSNTVEDASPTRSRSRNAQLSLGQECYLSLPKVPLCHRCSPTEPTEKVVPEHWRSSASASMIISSPVKQITNNGDCTSVPKITLLARPVQENSLASSAHTELSSSSRHRADSAQDEDDTLSHNSQGSQYAQAVISHQTPATIQTDSSTFSLQMQNAEAVQTLVPATVYRTSTSAQSVEQLLDTMPASCASSKREDQRASRRFSQQRSPQMPMHHDLVASPALASSTGFMYRKIGDPKATSINTSKSKPRAMDFSSPPALMKNARTLAKQSPQKMGTIQETSVTKQDAGVTIDDPVVSGVENVDNNGPEEEQNRHFSCSSRNSTYSTQAAMLLARLEFQESTFPTMSSETPRPWTQPQDDTPRPELCKPSFATTPLSVFKAPLDKSCPPETVFRGPPISTQDLFTAASPFAFSTAKKSERPHQSSLKFALLPQYDEVLRAGNSPARSPTPATDRIPLKEKNTTMSFWSLITEKTPQLLQESLIKDPRKSINDVESPQLDFHTSLDDNGHNSDLHSKNRVLRNLNNT